MSSNTPTSPSSPRALTGRRSNSFVGGFMKRSRSSDLLGERKTSSNNTRKDVSSTTSPVQTAAPKLPVFERQPQLQAFGGEAFASTMESPLTLATTDVVPHSRAQSMTTRGRHSYANSVVSSTGGPRRVRRRKDPTPYNVLVIGQRNSGKTSFLNFLRSSIAPRPDLRDVRSPELDLPPPSARTNPAGFVQYYQEVESENERVGLTIWDSPGFDKHLVEFQLGELNSFVESKFEDTFIEEMKVVRAPGLRDTHIHCVFFLFDPAQLNMNISMARTPPADTVSSLRKPGRIVGALDEDFELQILKSLQGKTTVIPVISKADTVTTSKMAYLKKMVGESFLQAGLDPLEALHFEGYDSENEMLEDVAEDDENTADKAVATEKLGQVTADGIGGETKDVPATTEPMENTTSATVPTTDAEPSTSNASAEPAVNGGNDTTSAVPMANTKKPLTHKREDSSLSVSTVMFDNGYMPMSVLSPDDDSTDGPIGRRFVWGFADPYNPEHCDFVKLKETCFTEWRADFREASKVKFYERWRTGRLKRGPVNGVKKSSLSPAPKPASGVPARVPVAARKPSGGIPIELVPRTKKYGS